MIIGLAAPEQFLMDKSLRDLQESNNKSSIDQLIEYYGISQEEDTKNLFAAQCFGQKLTFDSTINKPQAAKWGRFSTWLLL